MSGDALTGPSPTGFRAAAAPGAAVGGAANGAANGGATGGVAAGTAAARRTAKAIRDFQAVFLMEMMKPLTQELAGASSEDAAESGFGLSSGADVYSYFWGEALARHLASALPGLPGATAAEGESKATTSLPATGTRRLSGDTVLTGATAPLGGTAPDGGAATRAGQAARAGSAATPPTGSASVDALRFAGIPMSGFDPLAAGVTMEGVSALAAAPLMAARVAASAAPADATSSASPSAATAGHARTASGLSEDVRALAGKAGRLFSLPENLVRAVVSVESGGRANATSGAGAVGLMQLMPGTAKEMGVKDPHNPWDNLVGGAKYLARQLERFGRLDHALAAYNAGPGAVEKHSGIPPFPETRDYVRRVLQAKAQLDRTNPDGA